MSWQVWVALLCILVLSAAMICCVVLCATRCFYPAGTRGPKMRAFLPWRAARRPAGESGRYIMKNGELLWSDSEAPPRETACQA